MSAGVAAAVAVAPACARQTFHDRHPLIADTFHVATAPVRFAWHSRPVRAAREELAWDFHEVSLGAKWLNKKLDPYSDLMQGLAATAQVVTTFTLLRK